MKNALTIDLEDWYQTADLDIDIKYWNTMDSRIEKSTWQMLDMLLESDTCATFFILGCIAQKHPQLIREIYDRGHEIACHSTWHKMIDTQTPDEFKNDVSFSKKILEDIIGKKVTMFRAPTWSINSKNLWALEILDEEGFICDSSIQPFWSFISGMRGAPSTPFHPVIAGRKLDILEFPQTAARLWGLRIPFSGGLYLRVMPYRLVSAALERINTENIGMIYLHPWEIDVEQPRLKVSPLVRFTHYYNLKGTRDKIERLLNNFDFVTIGELIKDMSFPSISLVPHSSEVKRR